MNTKPTPRELRREIKRRLEKHQGAQLIDDSVKLVSIPETHFEATIFLFRKGNALTFVAELCRPGLPHIYSAHPVARDPRENAKRVVTALLRLSTSVLTDSRFRDNVILLNRHSANGSIKAAV